MEPGIQRMVQRWHHRKLNPEKGPKMSQKLKSRELAKDSMESRVQRVEKSQRESFAGSSGAESSYMTWQRVVLWISEFPCTCGLCLLLLFLFFPGRVYSSVDVPALLSQVGCLGSLTPPPLSHRHSDQQK